MAKLNISAEITSAVKTELETHAKAVMVLLPFVVNLDPKTRVSLRKMATKRTGYVADTISAVLAHPEVIPATFKVPEYVKDKVLFDDLQYVRNIYIVIVEAIDDTLLALGNELMTQSDTCYDYLKRASKDNVALGDTVKEIGKAFAGQGKKKNAKSFTLPAKGNVEIKNVVVGSRLVNSGGAILVMKAGADLANKLKTPPVHINPASSVIVPPGYTSIIIENSSQTDEGGFTVLTH
jgi:hypothetical protein